MRSLILPFVILLILLSCQKEEVENTASTPDLYGTYQYAFVKGTISDSITGQPLPDGQLLLRKVSPCLSGSYVNGGNYKIRLCKRVGGKLPFDFPETITLTTFDTLTEVYTHEFTIPSAQLIIDDTISIDLQY